MYRYLSRRKGYKFVHVSQKLDLHTRTRRGFNRTSNYYIIHIFTPIMFPGWVRISWESNLQGFQYIKGLHTRKTVKTQWETSAVRYDRDCVQLNIHSIFTRLSKNCQESNFARSLTNHTTRLREQYIRQFKWGCERSTFLAHEAWLYIQFASICHSN